MAVIVDDLNLPPEYPLAEMVLGSRVREPAITFSAAQAQELM